MNTKPVTLHLRADFSIHFQYKPFCNRKAESCRIFASCFICFIETFKDSLKIDPIRIFHSILNTSFALFSFFSVESSILYFHDPTRFHNVLYNPSKRLSIPHDPNRRICQVKFRNNSPFCPFIII